MLFGRALSRIQGLMGMVYSIGEEGAGAGMGEVPSKVSFHSLKDLQA